MILVKRPYDVAKALGLAAACVLGAGSVACHDDPANVGMSLGPGGSLEVFGSLCGEDERITGLRLWDGESGDVLWDIGSESGTRVQSFTAGSLPEDFEETVPFIATLDPAGSVGAEMEVRSSTPTFSIRRVYRVADLRVGYIRAHGDLIESGDWDDHVADRVCTTEKGIFG
jgi:hypothetical protein